MTDKPTLISRLSAACVGHPFARIPWPHRLLHEARAEIDRLRQRESVITDLMRRDIRDVLREADAYDENLDDPHGDDSGRDSKSPDGDDYNNLFDLLSRLRKYMS